MSKIETPGALTLKEVRELTTAKKANDERLYLVFRADYIKTSQYARCIADINMNIKNAIAAGKSAVEVYLYPISKMSQMSVRVIAGEYSEFDVQSLNPKRLEELTPYGKSIDMQSEQYYVLKISWM